MYGRIFTPFTIGPFTIIPEGELSENDHGIPLVLGKKGAFGSGEHETTVACLTEIAKLPRLEGVTALDLGSGTGILAIAAARLGASRVLAIDNDWRAAISCADNVRFNSLQDKVLPICGELSCLRSLTVDLVLANIYADIHLLLACEMVAMTRPGGHLILSGIPLQDKFDIQKRFMGEGCTMLDYSIGEEYVTFVMQRL